MQELTRLPPGKYIPRSLETIVRQAAADFPAVVITGPRQSGKTTLLKHLFVDQIPMISLEAPDVRLSAESDPRGFLALYQPPVVFDEIQNAPGLLPYIKERIDGDRNRAGQYILIGSQNLLLNEQVTESLAGRSAVLRLQPLSQREMVGDPARDARMWQASYIQTYLERDVRSLRNIGNLTQFQVYLRALANRSAQLLNLSELARDVGISVSTAKDCSATWWG